MGQFREELGIRGFAVLLKGFTAVHDEVEAERQRDTAVRVFHITLRGEETGS